MNSTPPVPTEAAKRPLVTFALFAFNQEEYIQEAIGGALAQTYQPLEIILSDDGSSDRTFDLIKEATARYVGPHRVRARRSPKNAGLVNHVRDVANEAQGEILVMAAGDDISVPHRTERLIHEYLLGAEAVCSCYDLIDENGEVLRRNQTPMGTSYQRLPWISSFHSPIFIYGATSSYLTEVVRALPKAGERVMSEDTPLNTIIQLQRRDIRLVGDSLVFYRRHSGSISNSSEDNRSFSDFLKEEERDRRIASVNIEILNYIRDEILQLHGMDSRRSEQYFESELRFLKIKKEWNGMGVAKRVEALMGAPDRRTSRWCASRLMGFYPLALFKTMARAMGHAPAATK